MKKVTTLVFALFFAAGLTYGQNNTGHTTGELSNALSQVDQTVEGAFITQTGTNNEALTEQDGTTNGATIKQDGPGSEAEINQVGGNNTALIDQQVGQSGGMAGGNSSSITQNGTDNVAFSLISADGNESDQKTKINQTGDNNKAGQIILDKYNNHMRITQNGNGNNAGQISDGRYHFGKITQSGDDNTASQVFTGKGNLYQTDFILQDGNRNTAHQFASGWNWDLTITQHGDDNMAKQFVNGSYTTEITQNGNMNKAVTIGY